MTARVVVCTPDEAPDGIGDWSAGATVPQPLEALVIDLDGVLVDSREQMIVALEESYRRHCGRGVPPVERFFALMGMPLGDILDALGLPRAMASTYREVSRQALHLVRVFPGVPELLESARGIGLRLALMTGKDRARAAEVLDRFGLSRFFQDSVCGDDPFPGKPDPQGLCHLIAGSSGRAMRAALIGDSPLDMQCAVAARVLALGAEWGVSGADDLRAAGADLTFASALELRDWLLCVSSASHAESIPAGVSGGDL